MHVLFACPHNNPDDWLPSLAAGMPDFKISVWDPTGPASGADVALVWKPPAALFAHETNLKAVFNLGAGVDAILKMPELPAHMQVVRLEDAGMSAQMAEYALYALLRVARNFETYRQNQTQSEWKPLPGLRREQWPVGVLGLGVVGARVARTIASLDYPVLGWSRGAHEIEGVRTFAGADQLPAFLSQTRVLINMLPLTPETTGILNRGNLQRLLPGAHLINAGRGEHQNEDDILALLNEGGLESATLDVFAAEPLRAGHPFWTHPRVHVTPHIAASTLRHETISQISAKIRQLARGEAITGVVTRERGY